ncbi:hypothetical protein Ciccas_007835 [Cichlidogyrus casuarinus]|uniref:Uncharacterized protein n=1 Tax=Cichlidogyrus casuarinus TaxID=1844966 RepID=A0ABD2Q1R1_9PLAT
MNKIGAEKQLIRRSLSASATTYTSSLGGGCTYLTRPDLMGPNPPHQNVIINANCLTQPVPCNLCRNSVQCICGPSLMKCHTKLTPTANCGHMITCCLDNTNKYLAEKHLQVPGSVRSGVCRFEISPFYPRGSAAKVCTKLCKDCRVCCVDGQKGHFVKNNICLEPLKSTKDAQTEEPRPVKMSHASQTEWEPVPVIMREIVERPQPIDCHLEITKPVYHDTSIQSVFTPRQMDSRLQTMIALPLPDAFDVAQQTDPIPIANTWVAHTMELCDTDADFVSEEIRMAARSVSDQNQKCLHRVSFSSGSYQQFVDEPGQYFPDRITERVILSEQPLDSDRTPRSIPVTTIQYQY